MPEVVPGYTTEHKTVTTTNDDASMNAVITAEAADSWLPVSLTFNGSDITILFTRTIAAEALP